MIEVLPIVMDLMAPIGDWSPNQLGMVGFQRGNRKDVRLCCDDALRVSCVVLFGGP